MPNKTDLEMNAKIGGMLRNARDKKGIPQSDMAKASGMSKNHISRIERGESKASVELLLVYCGVLEVTPNDILGYGNGRLDTLTEAVNALPAETKKKILKAAEILGLL